MARKPMNANIDIRKTARVFDEQAFDGEKYDDDYILCKYVNKYYCNY